MQGAPGMRALPKTRGPAVGAGWHGSAGVRQQGRVGDAPMGSSGGGSPGGASLVHAGRVPEKRHLKPHTRARAQHGPALPGQRDSGSQGTEGKDEQRQRVKCHGVSGREKEALR